MENELLQLGFTPHETTIYLALLDSGQTGAGEIIRKTSLHRNVVYTTLDKLVARQLVFKVTKDKKAQYQVTDPGRILHHAENNLMIAQKLVTDLKKRSQNKQEVTIYQGIDGFRDYSFNALNRIPKDGTLHVIGSLGDYWYELIGDQIGRYEKIMTEKQIHWKIIAYDDSKLDNDYIKRHPGLNEFKIIPRSYSKPANINIWQDTVAMQIVTEPYSVIEIKSAPLAEAYMNLFNTLWEMK